MDTKEQKLTEKCARVAKYLPLHKKATFPFTMDGGLYIEIAGICGAIPVAFNPLYNNGDVAKLEADLMLNVSWLEDSVQVGSVKELYKNHSDKRTARRVATVNAVAKMFKKEMHTIFPI